MPYELPTSEPTLTTACPPLTCPSPPVPTQAASPLPHVPLCTSVDHCRHMPTHIPMPLPIDTLPYHVHNLRTPEPYTPTCLPHTPPSIPTHIPDVPATLVANLCTRSRHVYTMSYPHASNYRYLTIPHTLHTPEHCAAHPLASLAPLPICLHVPAMPATLDFNYSPGPCY